MPFFNKKKKKPFSPTKTINPGFIKENDSMQKIGMSQELAQNAMNLNIAYEIDKPSDLIKEQN